MEYRNSLALVGNVIPVFRAIQRRQPHKCLIQG